MKYPKKLLVVGDVHTYYERADDIIKKFEKTHKLIFIGDYFDQFRDDPLKNQKTAIWLKDNLDDKNIVFLTGNHDEHYKPWFKSWCSGFTLQKKATINKILTIEDWNKLKYFHFENGWWFSHAGLTKEWFGEISGETDVERVQNIVDEAVIKSTIEEFDNAIWASDRIRGGKHKKGGLLWNDWSNMEFQPNLKQVVGHTPLVNIQKIADNVSNSHIVNVDASLKTPLMQVLEIDENGVAETIKLPEYL